MQDEILSLILGGGRGTRLYPLTMLRSKPAVPIAGKYRLIDIPISNCINSGCNRVYVLTQFLSVSLHRHIANTYKFDPFSRGFVEILAAQQTNEKSDWYQGTADAVRQNIRYVHEDPCRDVLILSGDQVYRMDFRHLLATHRDSGADVTIAVLPVTAQQTPGLGILKVSDAGRVVGFCEKPQHAEQLVPLKMPASWIEGRRGEREKGRMGEGAHTISPSPLLPFSPSSPKERHYLASMGIYLFKREALFHLLNTPPLATDFGREVFPCSIESHHVQAHLFDGYWEDVGTIKSYHDASLALCDHNPPFDFHAPEGLIYTRMRYLPASRIDSARMEHCLISDGCVVGAGSSVSRCVLGVRTQIGRDATLRNTVLIGADRYENPLEKEANRQLGVPNIGVGDGSVIVNAILDKDARVGPNVRILNEANVQDAEGPNYVIREGIVVIPKGAVVAENTVL